MSFFIQGKEIIEHFVNELRKDGITEVPAWVDPDGTNASTETVASVVSLDQKRSSVRRKKSTTDAPSDVAVGRKNSVAASPDGAAGCADVVSDGGENGEESDDEFHSGEEDEVGETAETATRRKSKSKLERTQSGDGECQQLERTETFAEPKHVSELFDWFSRAIASEAFFFFCPRKFHRFANMRTFVARKVSRLEFPRA